MNFIQRYVIALYTFIWLYIKFYRFKYKLSYSKVWKRHYWKLLLVLLCELTNFHGLELQLAWQILSSFQTANSSRKACNMLGGKSHVRTQKSQNLGIPSPALYQLHKKPGSKAGIDHDKITSPGKMQFRFLESRWYSSVAACCVS